MSENKAPETGAEVPAVPGVDVKIYLPKDPEKDHGKLLGFASVNLGGVFAVNNIRIYNTENGPYVSMPSTKGQDGKYHDICCPTTKEMRQALNAAVLSAYEKAVEQERSPSVRGTLKSAAKEAGVREAAAPAQERKSDFILSLMELIVGGKAGLEPVEKTVVDRCVHMVYREYLQDPRPEKMPVLGDLHALLCQQPEPEAQRLATALEIYVSGSLNVFNHRTNVKINSRIVCYVIKKLGKQLKKFGMQVVQDQVWGRVSENREAHKSTRLYIDEMHLLLREEQTAAYTVEIWKRFRKWGGIPTGITQNVKDLLSSREIENIFENSDFVYMLNQAGGDRQILAKQLNISPHQLGYVTNSNAGEGLLFFGSVIIPFVDHFPKDTELYSIMTTRPEDLAEQQ